MGRSILPSRRRFLQGGLALAGLGLLSGCGFLQSQAQQPAKLPTIGWVSGASSGANASITEAFLQGLREHGYEEGRNIAIAFRFADGQEERIPDIATELVRLGVAVIVTSGTQSALAAKHASGPIPIVSVSADPVGTGLVASLARPGGNITGFRIQTSGLFGKRLDLLKEAFPGVSRVANLGDAGNAASAIGLREVQDAGQKLALQVQPLEVRGPDDFENAFAAASRARVDALIVQDDALTLSNRGSVVDLAARTRLPAIYPRREFVERGGLLAYGVNFPDLWRRTASHVDKILKGAKPADLPVEQPTAFDFIINRKTAQMLGLTIPETVLLQATELLQ